MMTKFNPNGYYMGDTPALMKYTKWIEDKYPDFRYISYIHDWHFLIMLAQRNIIIKFIMGICYNIIYGIMGVVRGIKNISPGQIIISILAMIGLLFYLPRYLYKNRNRSVDLTRL